MHCEVIDTPADRCEALAQASEGHTEESDRCCLLESQYKSATIVS